MPWPKQFRGECTQCKKKRPGALDKQGVCKPCRTGTLVEEGKMPALYCGHCMMNLSTSSPKEVNFHHASAHYPRNCKHVTPLLFDCLIQETNEIPTPTVG